MPRWLRLKIASAFGARVQILWARGDTTAARAVIDYLQELVGRQDDEGRRHSRSGRRSRVEHKSRPNLGEVSAPRAYPNSPSNKMNARRDATRRRGRGLLLGNLLPPSRDLPGDSDCLEARALFACRPLASSARTPGSSTPPATQAVRFPDVPGLMGGPEVRGGRLGQ